MSSAAKDGPVGFIGLGNMGNGMAKNLLQKGEQVVAFDVDKASLDTAVAAGATPASSPAEVAASATRIVTMLPNNDIVRQVYTGSDGILGANKSGSLLIDSSTIDPAVSKELAEKSAMMGAVFVDAPVSGGVNAAAAGTLTFMVGAPGESDFERARDVLEMMGKNITHCGAVGTGQAVKICNNMLLAVSMIGVSETMNLGINLGLDKKLLAQILSSATGRCWSVDTYNPVPGVMDNVPSSNDYKGGFGSALMLKDLGLSQDAASRTESATPLGTLAHEIFKEMCKSGFAEKDFGSAFQYIKSSKR